MDDQQLLRYSRHILLDDVGIDGQQRLLSAKVLIVGAGGLGAPAALYLAAAGVGSLVIVDDDLVELGNLQRQIIYAESSVGAYKAVSAAQRLSAMNTEVSVIAQCIRLQGDALMAAVQSADVVLDCSDNFATRYALNRASVYYGVPLVSGAAVGFEGQLSVFLPKDPSSPCYHCLFPEQDTEALERRCATTGVFAPLTGMVGALQAGEALKILGAFGMAYMGRLLTVDALTGKIRERILRRDPLCEVCAHRKGSACV